LRRQMRAVVLDLFGTLSDPAAEVLRRAVVADTARALGVAEQEFWRHWRSSFRDRIIGRHGDTRQTLTFLAGACGATPTRAQFEHALHVHLQGAERLRAPRAGALGVLIELRRRGFAIGVLSDCSSEVVEGWSDSPYRDLVDAAVLSWQEGRRKPDPQLFATVATRLQVPPGTCWYVGDGAGRELSGARDAGMTPIVVTNALVPQAAGHRADPDDYTPQHQIPDLPDLLGLVRSAS